LSDRALTRGLRLLVAFGAATLFAGSAHAADAADAVPVTTKAPTPTSDAVSAPASASPAASAAAVEPAPAVVPPSAPSAVPASAAPPAPSMPAVPQNDADFYGAGTTDADAAAATYPKLELSGFTDFSFDVNVSPKSSPLRQIAYPYSTFSVGHLNLYLSAALAENWHLLAEVRFLYLPQGNLPFPSSGTPVVPQDTSVVDYADDDRSLTWGGIQIQRVQIDYTPHPLLSFRFGQWLTPVGIWNVDHGSPTVIGVYRPYIVGEGLFPERQTGIQVSGEWTGDTNLFGYVATLSNGRGPSDAYADLDNNKAIGGRLYWTNSAFGNLTLGVSGYKGTYSSRNRAYGLTTPPGQAPELVGLNPLTVSYREQTIAGDVRWQYKGLLVQGEAMQHEVVYDDTARPISVNGLPLADYRDRGYYALVGYRTPWLGIMPFVTVEGYNFASQPPVDPSTAESIGLNIRPEPTVVLKLQYHMSQLGSEHSSAPYRGTLNRILTQLAVAF